jgi:UDP-glucose 4-epimerase
MDNVLLTGGAGFIGSHLADMYLAEGHRVIIVDNLSTGKPENVPKGAVLLKMDLLSEDLEAVFHEHRPTLVNHHAAQVDIRKSMEDPAFDTRTNLFGTLHLLECCRHHPVRQFIFASSGGAIYGDDVPHPTPEDCAPHPLSVYGINKWCGEQLILAYAARFGFIATLLRYANVYGTRQNPHGEAGIIAIFLDRLRAGRLPVIHGDGTKVRDYVHVDDVVEINRFLTRNPATGPFNAGTGTSTSVNDLARAILAALGLETEIPHGPDKPGEQRVSVLDASKILGRMSGFGFMPLAEGLRRTVPAPA